MTTQETRRSLRCERSVMAREGNTRGADKIRRLQRLTLGQHGMLPAYCMALVDDGTWAHLFENQRSMGRLATVQR